MDIREKQSSEKRLIDSDEARRRIIAFATGLHSEVLPVDTVMMLLIQMPTVDAVPVVRCRECKHCDPENHHCDHHMGTSAPLRRKPDDFCSYGERKEGAD